MTSSAKRVTVAIAAFIAVLSLVWIAAPSGEPVCDGHALTHWMRAIDSSNQDEEAHAFAAIAAIGTNGLPVIISRLGTRDSWLQLQSLRLVQLVPFLRDHFTGPSEWRHKARRALQLAGEEAMRVSIPDLTRLSADKDPGVRLSAVEALSAFTLNDTAPVAALKAAQADPDSRVSAAARQVVDMRRAREQGVERLRELWPTNGGSPNGRAAEQPGNSGISGGPPSVSER